jgi:hypothetical protein
LPSILLTCADCGGGMRAGRPDSAGQGRSACRPCHKIRREAKPIIPAGWHCIVCGEWVVRTKGPIGMYCKSHKYRPPIGRRTRNAICKSCSGQFLTDTGRIYCSDKCRPVREPEAPATILSWRMCLCGKWICNPRRKSCSRYCSKELGAIQAGCRNRTCRQCESALGYFNRNHLCDQCRLNNKRRRAAIARKNPDRRAQNNHRHRARYFGVEYEPVKRAHVYERDGWRCGICRKKVDARLKYPHPESASLDHITPMALGGSHTYVNLQCAHLICNSRKSHHGTGDQLALIG